MLGLIYLLGIGLYFPALFNFFTHDNFFHFKISQADSLGEFLRFFSLWQAPEGWGYYRPLTTQLIYFIEAKLFNFNPLALNLIAMGMFLIVISLVYKLSRLLTQDRKMSLLMTFLYTVSATHFTHLYYVADQELGTAIFFFLTVILSIKFLSTNKPRFYWGSLATFGGALMSRESAVMIPLALALIYGLLKVSWKKIIKLLLPFSGILAVYGYCHVYYYGLISGDSYIWDFSLKTALNSWSWYGLWSLGLPQMLIDYVGPGLKINPNLWQFWGEEIRLILGLSLVLVILLTINLGLTLKKASKKILTELVFSVLWFLGLLLPVIFLPWHKFTIYLTIPLFGVVFFISRILKAGKFKITLGLILYLWLSISTLSLTRKTHWVSLGGAVAKRVYEFFNQVAPKVKDKTVVYFYDQPKDSDLPWKPSDQLKITLSDNNFFEVFYPGKFKAFYLDSIETATEPGSLKIPARQFLGY